MLNNFFIALDILFLGNLLNQFANIYEFEMAIPFLPGDEFHLRRIFLLIISLIFNNSSKYVKSKKILSINGVTDEHVHNSNALPELVNNVMKSDSRTITVGKQTIC